MKYYKIFFLVLCLLLLVVPVMQMNKENVATQENRTLAAFPLTRKDGKPNYEFGKEFERWLGDRFWGRTQLISARFWMMYAINGRIENDKAFAGDDGWMFKKSKIADVPSLAAQREKIGKDADILRQVADKFKDRNIPIYLVMIPEREVLYQKYWEKHYPPQPRLDYGDELINALKDCPNIHAIYPKSEFEQMAKTEWVFYQDDGHMTDLPKKLLIQKVFERLKQDYFPHSELQLFMKQDVVVEQHVSHIAALLGLQGQSNIILPHTTLTLSQQFSSQALNVPEYTVDEDTEYKGIFLKPWQVMQTNDAILDQQGIFYGPCYMTEIYDALSILFSKAVHIRPNVAASGQAAVELAQSKTNDLFNLTDNTIIFIMPPNLTLIEKALQEHNNKKK